MLYVDNRWSGLHGIGRFSSEVTKRLQVNHRTLASKGSPWSAREVFNPGRLRLGGEDIVWTPGYNVGFTRAVQIPTVHDLIHLQDQQQSSAPKRLYYERVLKPALRKGKLVLTVSTTSKAYLEEWIADTSVEVVIVGNGTSRAFLEPGDRAPRAGRFVIVGTSKTHKNLSVVLHALALRRDYSVSIITGDVNAVTALVAKAGVASQVTVLSGLSDEQLADEYRCATALLFPSILEGFGLPALEAMQCGCPVVYWAGCGSVAEIAAGTGFSVESAEHAEEWAMAMDSAVSSIEYSLNMPADWRRMYDWDEVASKVDASLSIRIG